MIRLATWIGGAIRGLVVLLLALCIVAVLALGALAWRLSQGPVEIDWAARRIEAALNRPDAPSRIALGGATLAWRGFAAGPGGALDLVLRDLVSTDRAERRLGRAESIEVSVSMGRLLRGLAVPRSIVARGVELRLVRAPDGAVTLDGGLGLGEGGDDAPDLAAALTELTRPVRREGAAVERREMQELQQLRHVALTDAVLLLHDRAMGGSWRLDLASLELRRQEEGGVLGQAQATLALGAARATLALKAELAPNGGTSVQVALAPIAAGAVQQAAEQQGAVPDQPTLMDAAIQGSASLLLNASLLPEAASLRLEAGGGRVRVAGAVIGFDGASIEAAASWPATHDALWGRPGTVELKSARVVLHAPGGAWPTTVTANGRLTRDGERIGGQVQAAVDHVAFADMAALWPERLGGNVRPWLVQNITAGTARDGAVVAEFTAGPDLHDLVLTRIDGSVVGEDVVIHWIRPVPPIERAQALLTIRSPQALDIAVSAARQGGVPITNGLIHINGLDVKDQFLQLDADAAGPVAEVIQLLRHPRLRLLDRKPIPMRNPGGSFAGHLRVNLPLNHDLDFDDVKIAAQVKASDLRLGGIVAGRDLERGEVTLEATSEALKAGGRATVAGIASQIQVDMDFRGGGQAQQVTRAQASGRASPAQLAAAGLDLGGIFAGGTGQVSGRYVQRRDGTAEVQMSGDLRDAALSLAGWTKPPGAPAEASARLLLRGDQMLGIDQLRAQGPGMAVEGRIDMVGPRPLLLRLDRAVLGATQGRGDVRLPSRAGEPVRLELNGPVLDLGPALARRPPGTPPETGQPFVADVRFDRVILSGDRAIGGGVTAHAEHDGRRVTALQASSAGPERLVVEIAPAQGGRSLAVNAADGGAVLRAMDLLDNVQGGTMSLRGLYDDRNAEPPLTGTMQLDGFRVLNAPALGKLLQAVTIYGVVEAFSGPGLSFSRLILPFRWDGAALDVTDAQAFSASLGLTARGRIDAVRKTIDLRGTVVPAYVLNSALGRIPLLGRLFSAEKGGGLVSVDYSLRGPVGDPAVMVNPLSALTPGFLRGLFRIFD